MNENDEVVTPTTVIDVATNDRLQDEPVINSEAPITTQVSPEVISFYQRYNLAMQTWVRHHGNTNFPIAEVKQKDGSMKLVWVNRAARKNLRKKRQAVD